MFTFFAKRNLKVKINNAIDHIIKEHVNKPMFWNKSMYLKKLSTNDIKELIFEAIWTPTYEIGVERTTYRNEDNKLIEEVIYRIYKT